MFFSALRLLLFVLTATALTACGTSPTAEASVVNATATPGSTVGADPILDVETELLVEQDVLQPTAEDSSENVPEIKLPEPQLKEVSRPATPPAPGPAPTPKQDGVETDVLVKPTTKPTSHSEGPPSSAVPTSPAPAAAPNSDTPLPPVPQPENATSSVPDHAAFNILLQQHVNRAGNVNYAAFKQAEGQLDAYLAVLAARVPDKSWSRAESMAYWINAYNAGTIKLILKNWPVKSIMDLHGGKPWDVKWIKLGGTTYSLNQIEHDIIRPRYQDPRIHFAVNCAAASCPPLPNQAFTPANLNTLLTSRTRAFIRNGSYNTISEDEVKVSKIFDWYGEDFGDLRTYLNKYAGTKIGDNTEIGFRAYDWALNKQ